MVPVAVPGVNEIVIRPRIRVLMPENRSRKDSAPFFSPLEHYHIERPHQGLGNEPPVRAGPAPPPISSANTEVECVEPLGGVLKSYRRAA